MRLVRIRWLDSRSGGAGWKFASTTESEKYCEIDSVGWVVREDKEMILIAPHVGWEKDDDNQICGEMVVPKCCIVWMREL